MAKNEFIKKKIEESEDMSASDELEDESSSEPAAGAKKSKPNPFLAYIGKGKK